MKLFKYDPKTQSFEFRIKDFLDEYHLKVLSSFKDHQCVDWTVLEELFADENEDGRTQAKTDSTYHLSDLGLIEYEHDKQISDGWDATTREQINVRKVSGYFLTSLGKSFVNSLAPKAKKK